MAIPFSDAELPTDPGFLADAVPLGLSLAQVATSLLVLNPHDPLPRELARDFGFTTDEQLRCRAVRKTPELLRELRTDLAAMHCYLAVARYALDCPPIWQVVAASLQASEDPEEVAVEPEPAVLAHKYRQCHECVGAALQLARRAASHDSALAEELRLREMAVQGVFARLGPTIRPGIAPRTGPDAPAAAPFVDLSAPQAQLLLAISLLDHLPGISDHALVRDLLNSTGPADLRAYGQRVQDHFGPAHPDFALAAAGRLSGPAGPETLNGYLQAANGYPKSASGYS